MKNKVNINRKVRIVYIRLSYNKFYSIKYLKYLWSSHSMTLKN